MADHDPAFDVIPQGSTYFLIWRVKDFELVPVPKESYGSFFKGDSYVVICCSEYRNSGHSGMPVEPIKSGGVGWIDIHFWIGSKSSQDEAGVAAIKTVELDDFLGGSPLQHRETEGNESKQFLAYFRNGIRLLNGGFESGFHKVDDQLNPALYQVKGKKRPLMHELNSISWEEMNTGDCFLLIAPKYIFVWTGKKANHFERLKAIQLANDLKNELSRFHLSIVILDDGQESEQLSDAEHLAFNTLLPLEEKDAKIKSSDEFDFSDEQFESTERTKLHLYRCKEEDGNIDIESIKDGPLVRADLDSNDSFIVDNGANGIWVWVGKGASKQERSKGLKYAMELVKKKQYPDKTEVTKVIEDGEPVEFRALFKLWSGDVSAFSAANPEKHSRLFNLLRNGKFNQVASYEQHDLEEDNAMVLDAGTDLFVWIGKHLQERHPDETLLGKIAKFYLKQDNSGRELSSENVFFEKQGSESEHFKSFFPSWN